MSPLSTVAPARAFSVELPENWFEFDVWRGTLGQSTVEGDEARGACGREHWGEGSESEQVSARHGGGGLNARMQERPNRDR